MAPAAINGACQSARCRKRHTRPAQCRLDHGDRHALRKHTLRRLALVAIAACSWRKFSSRQSGLPAFVREAFVPPPGSGCGGIASALGGGSGSAWTGSGGLHRHSSGCEDLPDSSLTARGAVGSGPGSSSPISSKTSAGSGATPTATAALGQTLDPLDAGAASSEPAVEWLTPTTASALLVLLAGLYGANIPLLKSVDGITPARFTIAELLAVRFVGASTVLLPWIAQGGREVKAAILPACELGFWLWLGYFFQVLGLEKVAASESSILFALCGLVVTSLEFVFERKPLSIPTVVSCLGALVSLWFFVTAPVAEAVTVGAAASEKLHTLMERVSEWWDSIFYDKQPLPHQQLLEHVPGEALALVGTFFFAVHCWRSAAVVSTGPPDHRRFRRRAQASESDADSLGSTKIPPLDNGRYAIAVSAIQCIVAAILCVIFSLADSTYSATDSATEQMSLLGKLSVDAWLQILACGMLCTGLPHALELFALKLVAPSQAALIYCTIPLWGCTFGILFLGETFSAQAWIAGGFILLFSLLPSALDVLGTAKSSSDQDTSAPEVATAALDDAVDGPDAS